MANTVTFQGPPSATFAEIPQGQCFYGVAYGGGPHMKLAQDQAPNQAVDLTSGGMDTWHGADSVTPLLSVTIVPA